LSFNVCLAFRSSPAAEVDDLLLLDDREGDLVGRDGEAAVTVTIGTGFGFGLFPDSAATAAAAAAATSDDGDSESAGSGLFGFRENEGPRRLDCSGGKPLKQIL